MNGAGFQARQMFKTPQELTFWKGRLALAGRNKIIFATRQYGAFINLCPTWQTIRQGENFDCFQKADRMRLKSPDSSFRVRQKKS